ncbi:MAG: hypothetical protein CSA95_08050 [Bacteroidetes bacterium]|nr:MAG: hypothetical protein CSA95_08050 [Bacteroidota bacterium]
MKSTTIIPLEFVPLEEGYHLMITARVNGKEVRMLIDTGASRTCFDRQRIVQIPAISEEDLEGLEKTGTGLGTNTMESAGAILNTFCIGTLCLSEYPVVVIDMQHVNASYSQLDLPPIDGVIGSELLLQHQAVINYARKHLELTIEGC